MMKILMLALVLAGLWASPPDASAHEYVYYHGWHPVPVEFGGGWCDLEGPHWHLYYPTHLELFAYEDGYYYFVGDPWEYGYMGVEYWYEDAHPVYFGIHIGICYIFGPHRHYFSPAPAYAHYYHHHNGHYVYKGAWPKHYVAGKQVHPAKYYAKSPPPKGWPKAAGGAPPAKGNGAPPPKAGGGASDPKGGGGPAKAPETASAQSPRRPAQGKPLPAWDRRQHRVAGAAGADARAGDRGAAGHAASSGSGRNRAPGNTMSAHPSSSWRSGRDRSSASRGSSGSSRHGASSRLGSGSRGGSSGGSRQTAFSSSRSGSSRGISAASRGGGRSSGGGRRR